MIITLKTKEISNRQRISYEPIPEDPKRKRRVEHVHAVYCLFNERSSLKSRFSSKPIAFTSQAVTLMGAINQALADLRKQDSAQQAFVIDMKKGTIPSHVEGYRWPGRVVAIVKRDD